MSSTSILRLYILTTHPMLRLIFLSRLLRYMTLVESLQSLFCYVPWNVLHRTTFLRCSYYVARRNWSFRPGSPSRPGSYFQLVESNSRELLYRASVPLFLRAFLLRRVSHRILPMAFLGNRRALHRSERDAIFIERRLSRALVLLFHLLTLSLRRSRKGACHRRTWSEYGRN